ncbi:hypothetical protein EDE08_104423 [Bradyrhizobium sp. R2.2-H]|jgi:hypothetical protein|uniref:hypothetical protein n=1 Tax=unclassified Bradyrhizobium TaxID=2631580 RepID=UPI00104B8B05|nr:MULTISPECIES: hypothetical protein [unclassified Bradyrhizobium]TCU73553.1 hypothetical protein EDE10_104219 [Bradyrhizobium sp. Y-H1]TCU76257.1 hypothetical protein EDE08_104423 [Bradyrhizobium sp. R2.2-H]
MVLSEFVNQVAGFDKLPPREKIKLIGWYLHTYEGKEHFHSDHIRACYKTLHLVTKENIGQSLMRMASYNTPDLVREKQGFKLTRPVRSQFDTKYGNQPSMQAVSKLLTDLPGKVPNSSEKVFLSEAIDCYRVKAYRACIVMTWNLAFDHLLNWILKDPARLDSFNAAIPKKFQSPKKSGIVIKDYDDFSDELKESEIIDLCKTAQLLNDNVVRTLREKLGRRNTAAHPSTMVVLQPQADDTISDLVHNVVLALT